ncbi:ATP-dependent RNA helicase DEAH11, chloroplastic-like isoform X2 [Aristolochia californica]|uniref:ATP-dependent RNA helicase DEAH11, chloroplastic-like isoform X2 n=1 Tax=Aristolochia californica TaxID=171875 RepID=UPI0035DD4BD3
MIVQRGSSRPNFTVDLRSGCRTFVRSELEALVRSCPVPPDRFDAYRSGPIAGRVYFQQLCETIEFVVFFWERRLLGIHSLTPQIRSSVFLPSDREELSDRLRALFSARVRELLDGDSVRRCLEKLENLADEIGKVSRRLREAVPLALCSQYLKKKKGLVAEREMVERNLEEFTAAMHCILARLDGTNSKECPDLEIPVLRFGDALDWGSIHRIMARECRRLDDGLPIYAHRREILRQIYCQQVILLIGETGSGKSTQLVQFILDSGLANGSIVCTQPRKIAARSLAQRVREESCGCYSGDSVVCYPSYSSLQRFNTKVVFTTDHCLLQHSMSDANLTGISFIIIDEAHERSLNTDLLLALVKKLLLQKPHVRLIIMSATVDAEKFSDYFFGCAILHVRGRSYPVDIQYMPYANDESSLNTTSLYNSVTCASYVSATIKAVREIHKAEDDGAILAFLTSQSEVEWACETCQIPAAVVLPLHGKLSCEEQVLVFQEYPGKRKVIFATNLAETSLTIPDVRYVVDSGMVKESRFDPGNGMNVLKVSWVSHSSAHQRAGRAGRTRPGKCYRLYSEHEFETLPSHQEPEIRKVHLGIAVLRILSLGIKNVQDFDFVDVPDPKAIEMAIRNLIQLGAVVSKYDILELTDVGRHLVKLGIEPKLGKIILDSCHCRLGREGLVLAAVMANSSSIFCRVGTVEEKSKADCLKVQFCHGDGDLFTLLSVYRKWESESQASRNIWCWNNSINAKSMRRCKEIMLELEQCLRQELQINIPDYWIWDPDKPSLYDKTLKKVILSSLAENVAMYSGYDHLGYEVALTGQHVKLHPSCSLLLYGQKPSWVVFGEILSISNQYLVCVTAFDYECFFMLEPAPPFDISMMEEHKMQKTAITGLGSNLLKRFSGKLYSRLHCLVKSIRTACEDPRIGIDVDFDKGAIEFFASPRHIKEVSAFVNTALQYETKWLNNECIEKCLFRGAPGYSPSVALFGSGAEIKHLEVDKRYLSVEIYHPVAHSIDDKELLVMFDKNDCHVANFYKYGCIGQENYDLEKWGKITFLSPESAERAVRNLNGAELCGSLMKVMPLKSAFLGDERSFPFHAIKARVSWSRRPSKGIAIVRCKFEDVDPIVAECSTLIIGGRFIRCKIGQKSTDSVVLTGLDPNTTEPEIWDALRNVTKRRILDVFLLRGEAVDQPSINSCADALLREIAAFMPVKNTLNSTCRVQVLPPEPTGVHCNLERMDNGLYRVKISSTGTRMVADMRKPLEQLMKGKTVSHPNLTPSVINLLFSREGVDLMKTLEKETQTYILHDKQHMNIKIFGSPDQVIVAERKMIQSLLQLHENKQLEVCLRGGDLPPDLLKEVVQVFGPQLHGLKEKVPGADFVLNTRRHSISFRGSKELKKRVEDVICEIAHRLTEKPSGLTNPEVACPICLCEVEECYQLEACGHRFCRLCLVEQCESATRSREGFPLCCTFTGCKSKIWFADLRALLSNDKLEDLFRASVGVFVASSSGAYRFCPTPDCPAVYKAVETDSFKVQPPPFACGACYVETCRKCHMEYHPYMSCKQYRAIKEDPDLSLNEWRKGKEHVKSCPTCAYTIEKVEGCNHIECKCGRHICWVCLECFFTSDECYAHLRSVHLTIV